MKYVIAFLTAASPAFSACPDPSIEGPAFAASGPELIAPQRWDVPVGGDQAAPCGTWVVNGIGQDRIDGFLPLGPTGVVTLTGMAPYILTARIEADCAPLLVLRSGDGQWFVPAREDGPEVILWSAPDGPLQVWVGSRSREVCEGTLILETFDR